jgi:ubiquinone/menaquinone biosynthesis C-methylase UbiE
MQSKVSFYRHFNKEFFTTDAYDDYLQRFEKQGLGYALRLKKFLNPKKDWKFLDIGCGMGGIVLALRKMGFRAFGTEISPFCFKESPVRQWMEFGDMVNLPFKDNSFNVSICIDVTYYLTKKELKKAIKDLSRITKKYIYIETISRGAKNSKQKINPDPLRKGKSLLTSQQLISLLKKEKFYPLSPLFNKKEKKDFNLVFEKRP